MLRLRGSFSVSFQKRRKAADCDSRTHSVPCQGGWGPAFLPLGWHHPFAQEEAVLIPDIHPFGITTCPEAKRKSLRLHVAPLAIPNPPQGCTRQDCLRIGRSPLHIESCPLTSAGSLPSRTNC